MSLPAPEIPILKSYPKGADLAAVFPGGQLTLTYWDLWCLITARHQCQSDLKALRAFLMNRRLNDRFWSFSCKELVEDLITLVDDLKLRIISVGSVEEILSVIPERLIKKETQKGIKNITGTGTYYPPSEPMLRSPRRLLEKEALRGMWPKLPYDPTPIAEKLRPVFLPPPKPGYFSKGMTFALSRRVEKAVARLFKEADRSDIPVHPRAYRYAVHRAALTLFQEEHHWDDSYGVMGDLAKEWWRDLFTITADDLCLEPYIFLKDLLMFSCWEVYGVSEEKQVAAYISKLSADEQELATSILNDIYVRAAQGFQDYRAEEAQRILKSLGVEPPRGPLRLVAAIPQEPNLSGQGQAT
jgi:hypothetical protein